MGSLLKAMQRLDRHNKPNKKWTLDPENFFLDGNATHSVEASENLSGESPTMRTILSSGLQ